jgi:hypothetical protein
MQSPLNTPEESPKRQPDHDIRSDLSASQPADPHAVLHRGAALIPSNTVGHDVFEHDSPTLKNFGHLSEMVFTFNRFDGLTLEDLNDINSLQDLMETEWPSSLEDYQVLEVMKQLVRYTGEAWQNVQRKGHIVLADDPAEFVKLVTRPHSQAVVLRTVAKGAEDQILTPYEDVEGYVLFNTNPDEYPDIQYIPEDLLSRNPIRGLRAHIRGKGTQLGPDGEALERIMGKAFEICGDRPMVTKIATNHRWSSHAFQKLGFERTGDSVIHPAELEDGTTAELEFEWYEYPPRTEPGEARRARYRQKWEELDVSRRQKFAETVTHFSSTDQILSFISPGHDNDSSQLGAFFPDNFVLAQELDSQTNTRYQFNTRHVEAPVAGLDFPEGTFDGIIVSGALPTLAQKGPSRSAHENLRTFLEKQIAQLGYYQKLDLRDRVVPEAWTPVVHVHVPESNGAEAGEPAELSTAALLKRYADSVTWPASSSQGIIYTQLPSQKEGFATFALEAAPACSFGFAKEYTRAEDWQRESEKPIVFAQRSIVSELRELGVRILNAGPRRNRWVADNHFSPEKISYSDPMGNPLRPPEASFSVVAERIPQGEGVELYEAERKQIESPEFLILHRYQHSETGDIRDVVERPYPVSANSYQTTGYLLWSKRDDGEIEIRIKKGFPRPIQNVRRQRGRLDRSHTAGYAVEDVSAVTPPDTSPEETLIETLALKTGLSVADIIQVGSTEQVFMPSPGTTNEVMTMVPVEITPQENDLRVENYSGFSTSGVLSSIELSQYLRSSQVGGLTSARLVTSGYELMIELGEELGPWLGERVSLTSSKELHSVQTQKFVDLMRETTPSEAKNGSLWEEIPYSTEDESFFELWRSRFAEIRFQDDERSEVELEWVAPSSTTGLSPDTATVAPVVMINSAPHVVVELRGDLPAADIVLNQKQLPVIPAFRLPVSVHDFDAAEDHIQQAFEEQFGLRTKQFWQLGARYTASSGAMPEEVYPWAVEIDAASIQNDPRYAVIPLSDLFENRASIKDGHTLTSTYWLAHQFGLIH